MKGCCANRREPLQGSGFEDETPETEHRSLLLSMSIFLARAVRDQSGPCSRRFDGILGSNLGAGDSALRMSGRRRRRGDRPWTNPVDRTSQAQASQTCLPKE
jgi:hypothetical protein